jgi:hypothetical protein
MLRVILSNQLANGCHTNNDKEDLFYRLVSCLAAYVIFSYTLLGHRISKK